MTGPQLDPIFNMDFEGRHIRIYRRDFPAGVAREIESIYQNIFSSIEKFAADGNLGSAECYVSASATGIEAVLFFARKRGTIEVLNSAIALSSREADIFCKAVFRAYPAAHAVRFESVHCDMAGITLPHQRFDCQENIVLALPSSVPAYMNSLGKGMRASIRRNYRKLQNQVEGFAWKIYRGADISAGQVQELIALSSARINSLNMKTSHTDIKTRRLTSLLKSTGSVLVATVNGKICGGVICTVYGGNYYMHVVAHDAAYRAYSLGKVCIFLSIQHAIENGAKEYQFLWGPYPYKFDFLGQQRNYDRIVIYRSALWMALKLRLFITIAVRGYGRQARIWLRNRHRHIRTELS